MVTETAKSSGHCWEEVQKNFCAQNLLVEGDKKKDFHREGPAVASFTVPGLQLRKRNVLTGWKRHLDGEKQDSRIQILNSSGRIGQPNYPKGSVFTSRAAQLSQWQPVQPRAARLAKGNPFIPQLCVHLKDTPFNTRAAILNIPRASLCQTRAHCRNSLS